MQLFNENICKNTIMFLGLVLTINTAQKAHSLELIDSLKGKLGIQKETIENTYNPQDQISEIAYLDKLSKKIRGIPPSAEEFTKLQTLKSKEEKEKFLSTKTDEYLKSMEFTLKMMENIRYLFRFPSNNYNLSPSAYDISGYKNGKYFQYSGYAEMLYKQINIQDKSIDTEKSWDQILIGLDITSKESANATTSNGYVSSMFNSNAFLERYPTSDLNNNRKRAAAIFRIMLCDSMMPAVEIGESLSAQDREKIFGSSSDSTEAHPAISNAEKLHGQRQDCMACHSKLDPMASLIRDYHNNYGIKPALHFKNITGKTVDIPEENLVSLLYDITQQKEYVNCQVRHFWEMYIGPYNLISPFLAAKLAAKYDELKRQPRSFIRYLVQSPEFRVKQEVRFGMNKNNAELKIRNNLAQCTSCHLNQTESKRMSKKDFTLLVDQKSNPKNPDLAEEIVEVLKGNGDKTMPPQESDFKLNPQDRQELIDYLTKQYLRK